MLLHPFLLSWEMWLAYVSCQRLGQTVKLSSLGIFLSAGKRTSFFILNFFLSAEFFFQGLCLHFAIITETDTVAIGNYMRSKG